MEAIKRLLLVSIILLILAIPSIWPYGYYVFLRWFVFLTAILGANLSFKLKFYNWGVGMVIIFILFNPIIPVHLTKETWIIFDILTAIIMFIYYKKIAYQSNL